MTQSAHNALEATMLIVRPQRVSGARIPPGRRPWQQRGRRHRTGPQVQPIIIGAPRPPQLFTPCGRDTALGSGWSLGTGSGSAQLGWQGTEALWEN